MRPKAILLVGLFVILLLAPFAGLAALYFKGLRALPDDPRPPATDGIPSVLMQAYWANMEATGPIAVEPMGPWNLARYLARLAMSDDRGREDLPPGLASAAWCARSLVRRDAVKGNLGYQIANISIGFWQTTH